MEKKRGAGREFGGEDRLAETAFFDGWCMCSASPNATMIVLFRHLQPPFVDDSTRHETLHIRVSPAQNTLRPSLLCLLCGNYEITLVGLSPLKHSSPVDMSSESVRPGRQIGFKAASDRATGGIVPEELATSSSNQRHGNTHHYCHFHCQDPEAQSHTIMPDGGGGGGP